MENKINYFEKYFKYKTKYLELKKEIYGGEVSATDDQNEKLKIIFKNKTNIPFFDTVPIYISKKDAKTILKKYHIKNRNREILVDFIGDVLDYRDYIDVSKDPEFQALIRYTLSFPQSLLNKLNIY